MSPCCHPSATLQDTEFELPSRRQLKVVAMEHQSGTFPFRTLLSKIRMSTRPTNAMESESIYLATLMAPLKIRVGRRLSWEILNDRERVEKAYMNCKRTCSSASSTVFDKDLFWKRGASELGQVRTSGPQS